MSSGVTTTLKELGCLGLNQELMEWTGHCLDIDVDGVYTGEWCLRGFNVTVYDELGCLVMVEEYEPSTLFTKVLSDIETRAGL